MVSLVYLRPYVDGLAELVKLHERLRPRTPLLTLNGLLLTTSLLTLPLLLRSIGRLLIVVGLLTSGLLPVLPMPLV